MSRPKNVLNGSFILPRCVSYFYTFFVILAAALLALSLTADWPAAVAQTTPREISADYGVIVVIRENWDLPQFR